MIAEMAATNVLAMVHAREIQDAKLAEARKYCGTPADLALSKQQKKRIAKSRAKSRRAKRARRKLRKK